MSQINNMIIDSIVSGVGAAAAIMGHDWYTAGAIDRNDATAGFLVGTALGAVNEVADRVIDFVMGYFNKQFNIRDSSDQEVKDAAANTQQNLKNAVTLLAVVAVPFVAGRVAPELILNFRNVASMAAGAFIASLLKGAYDQTAIAND